MRALQPFSSLCRSPPCGFRPLSCGDGHSRRRIGCLRFHRRRCLTSANDAEEIGLDLERALHDVLSQPGNAPAPVYRLRVRLTDERRPLAIQDDSSIARYTYRLSARWTQLPANAEEETKPPGRGRGAGDRPSMSVDSQFATVVARRDAEKRAARDGGRADPPAPRGRSRDGLMNVPGRQAECVLQGPPPQIRAVLLYGPDEGLASERARRLGLERPRRSEGSVPPGPTLGRRSQGRPARLADEAAAISMLGGRRVVRVTGADNTLAKLFEGFVADPPGDALVVVEAGDLGKGR